MASKYAMIRNGSRYLKDEDFEEGDVWFVMETVEVISSDPAMRKWKDVQSSSTIDPCARGLVRRSNNSTKEVNSDDHHVMFKQQSAPMGISEIRMTGSTQMINIIGVGPRGRADSWVQGHVMDNYDNVDDDDNEEEERIVPPHEYIARKLARRQIYSFSVCEGIGRTLKGRDLRQARNAILRSTGFLES
ncbi:hypothetical protein Droror1_Dr00020640 [Drosera rotundifolia]